VDTWDGLRTWGLGDRLSSAGFKNSVMKRVHKFHSMTTPNYNAFLRRELEWCEKHTARGSLLRNFVVDTMVQHWVFGKYIQSFSENWVEYLEELPKLRAEMLCIMAGICLKGNELPDVKPLAKYLERSES
jgi:hypothetical protein